jgi:tRNA pseudouridine38-40 synthase
MRRAASALTGRHDFRTFEGADPTHGDAHDTVCTLARCAIRRQAHIVAIEFEGDRFLKYMVRNIVGTLVEIGLGRRAASGMSDRLASGDRRQAGVTAPAHGLTLVEVYYARPRHKRPRSRRT